MFDNSRGSLRPKAAEEVKLELSGGQLVQRLADPSLRVVLHVPELQKDEDPEDDQAAQEQRNHS